MKKAASPRLCLLILCLALSGCSEKVTQAKAVVMFPEDVKAQTELMTYAQSPAFETDLHAVMPADLRTDFEIEIRQQNGTRVVELAVTSVDSATAAQAANAMSKLLTVFATKEALGAVQILEQAVPDTSK